MSVLERIAYYRGIRDEKPNQELAAHLARTGDSQGVAEIAENLGNRNRSVQSDCLKVLYEIGYIKPDLVAPHVEAFLELLSSRNNRMVWGATIALATIAHLKPQVIWRRIDEVVRVTSKGTVITLVWGIRTLARVAAAKKSYADRIVPVLQELLSTCNPRDVPTHLESMIPAIKPRNKARFVEIAQGRTGEMTRSHLTRLRKVLRKLGEV